MMKKGDHIFANGLLQTINELTARASLDLGSVREGKILDEMFTSCRCILEQSPYQLTVDKGDAAPSGDTHSQIFGRHTEIFKFAMISYITALKSRHDRPVNRSNVEGTHFAIRDTIHWIDLHIEDWVRLACDPEAERLMPENRKEIAQGKEDLRQIKTLILATIRKI
jgi:hypothetical protein